VTRSDRSPHASVSSQAGGIIAGAGSGTAPVVCASAWRWAPRGAAAGGRRPVSPGPVGPGVTSSLTSSVAADRVCGSRAGVVFSCGEAGTGEGSRGPRGGRADFCCESQRNRQGLRGTAKPVPDLGSGTRGSRNDLSLVACELVSGEPVTLTAQRANNNNIEFSSLENSPGDHDFQIQTEVTRVCTAIPATKGQGD
jgi:hypothetical protein